MIEDYEKYMNIYNKKRGAAERAGFKLPSPKSKKILRRRMAEYLNVDLSNPAEAIGKIVKDEVSLQFAVVDPSSEKKVKITKKSMNAIKRQFGFINTFDSDNEVWDNLMSDEELQRYGDDEKAILKRRMEIADAFKEEMNKITDKELLYGGLDFKSKFWALKRGIDRDKRYWNYRLFNS